MKRGVRETTLCNHGRTRVIKKETFPVFAILSLFVILLDSEDKSRETSHATPENQPSCAAMKDRTFWHIYPHSHTHPERTNAHAHIQIHTYINTFAFKRQHIHPTQTHTHIQQHMHSQDKPTVTRPHSQLLMHPQHTL